MTIAHNSFRQKAVSVCLTACVLIFQFVSAPAVSAQEQLKGTITKMGGLNTAVFETPHGKLKVNLPDDAAGGDTISGTVVAEPSGSTPEEKAKNEDELVGYVVAVRPKPSPGTLPVAPPQCKPGQPMTFTLPPGCSNIDVACNPPGTASANSGSNCSIPCEPTPPKAPPAGVCTMPTVGQGGKPFQVQTPCDGKFDNSACKVGGLPCKMLAESPRKMVAESPREIVGPSQLMVQEGNQACQGPFCNVKVKLFCPNPVLHQGETSTLTATVVGLKNVQNAKLAIDNNSPDVLSLSGGDHQVLSLAPPQAMYSKMGSACPDDKGTPTDDPIASPTSYPASPGAAPFPVPPMGSQNLPGGGNVSVYPGGTAVTTPPGGAPVIITPPGLGSAPSKGPGPGKGEVIARQVEKDGTLVQVYENGFVSRTPPGGVARWDAEPIF